MKRFAIALVFMFYVLSNGMYEYGPFRDYTDCFRYQQYYGMWSYTCEVRW